MANNSVGSRYSSLSTLSSSNSENARSKTLSGLTPGSKEEKAALAELRHERLLFVLGSLLGTWVEVEVKGGSIFKGIFHGASKELGICLKYCYLFEEKAKTPKTVFETLVVEPKDFVQLIAKDVDLGNEDYVKGSFCNEWSTDAEIAATKTGSTGTGGARELQPFEQVVSLPGDISNGVTFGDLDASVVPEWDQFALNKEKFGVNSTFKEELYTTKLDRSAPDFDAKLRKAEELAQEIRRAETNNIHLKQEREQELERDYDEETLYGAVVRDNDAVEVKQNHPDTKSGGKTSMTVLKEELSENAESAPTTHQFLYVSDYRQRTTEEFRRFKEEMDKKVRNASMSMNENEESRQPNNDMESPEEDNPNFQLPRNVKDDGAKDNSVPSSKKSVGASRLNVHAAEFRPGQGFIYQTPNNGTRDQSFTSLQEESGLAKDFASLSTNEGAKFGTHSQGNAEPSTVAMEEDEYASSSNAHASYQSVSYPYGLYPASGSFVEGSPTFVPYNMPVGYNGKSGFVAAANATSPSMMGRNMVSFAYRVCEKDSNTCIGPIFSSSYECIFYYAECSSNDEYAFLLWTWSTGKLFLPRKRKRALTRLT